MNSATRNLTGRPCPVCDTPTRPGHTHCEACEDFFNDDQNEVGTEADD